MDRTLPKNVIANDQRLRTRIADDTATLQELRYHCCCTKGWGYTEYGRSVGIVSEAIRQSVLKHASIHGLPVITPAVRAKEAQRVGKARGSRALRTATAKPQVKAKSQGVALPQCTYDAVRIAAEREGISVVRWVTEVVEAYLGDAEFLVA